MSKTPSAYLLPVLCGAIEALVRKDGPDLTARGLSILLVAQTTSGPHTVRGIAEELAIPKPVVTRHVDRLEHLGYMTRRKNPADRRSLLMAPTPAGRAYIAVMQRGAAKAARMG